MDTNTINIPFDKDEFIDMCNTLQDVAHLSKKLSMLLNMRERELKDILRDRKTTIEQVLLESYKEMNESILLEMETISKHFNCLQEQIETTEK